MSDQPGFFTRLGTWFKPVTKNSDPALLEGNGDDRFGRSHGDNGPVSVDVSRNTFLRPWAKRDAAIHQLQDGFSALTGLMSAIKDSLEKHGSRQDELMKALGDLPDMLRSIPESGAAQTETLKAIAEQIKYQNVQQAQLADILEKVAQTGGDQRQMLDGVRERLENLGEHDRNITESLSSVGTAMHQVSRSSQTSAQVLEQMRDNTDSREGELQRLLHKQSVRYTTMLAVSIFLAIAALVAVCIMGYLVMTKLPR
jgi:chromosome segregation ATPase